MAAHSGARRRSVGNDRGHVAPQPAATARGTKCSRPRPGFRRDRNPDAVGWDCCRFAGPALWREETTPRGGHRPSSPAARLRRCRRSRRPLPFGRMVRRRCQGARCRMGRSNQNIASADGFEAPEWPPFAMRPRRTLGCGLRLSCVCRASPIRCGLPSGQQCLEAAAKSSFFTHVQAPPCKAPRTLGARGSGGHIPARTFRGSALPRPPSRAEQPSEIQSPKKIPNLFVHLALQLQRRIVHRQHNAAELKLHGRLLHHVSHDFDHFGPAHPSRNTRIGSAEHLGRTAKAVRVNGPNDGGQSINTNS